MLSGMSGISGTTPGELRSQAFGCMITGRCCLRPIMRYRMGWSARSAAIGCRAMDATEWIARNLANALLAGQWTQRSLLARMETVLERRTKKAQQALVKALIANVTTAYPPSPRWLTTFFLRSPVFKQACGAKIKNPHSVTPVLKPPRFAPNERFSDLAVPRLTTPGDP